MLKNKFLTIILIMVIILAVMIPIVRADDNTNQTTEEQSVIEGAEAQATQNNVEQETYKNGDVYLTGDEITIDYIVDGNLFVLANTVTINSQIGGDAFIIANDVTVNEAGYIFSNLFTVAKNVNINGVVYDLYSYSNNVNINGYVYRDVRTIADNISLSGTIGRNVYLKTNNINTSTDTTDEAGNTLTTQGSINGDLNYISNKELSIPEGVVTGSINYTQNSNNSSVSIQAYILSLGRFIVTVIIIWLLCLWLTPKFLNNTDLVLSKKLPSTIGLGILTPILLMIISVILLLINITSNISGLGLIILFVICMLSASIFTIALNNLICKKLSIEKTLGKLGFLIITSTVLWVIALIPYIGGIITLIISVLGIGILINSILPANRNIDFSKINSKNTETEKTNKESKSKETTKKENVKKETKTKETKQKETTPKKNTEKKKDNK